MTKKIKRLIAAILTLAFAISLVPNVVFAETAETVSATIPWTNYAYSRDTGTDGNGDPSNYTYKYQKFTEGSKEYHVIVDGGSFDGYLQLDLTGYEEILKNPSTTVSYSVGAGAQYGSSKLYNFSFVLAPDKVDGYSNQTITHNIAKSLGFLNTTDRPILFSNTQGGDVKGEGLGLSRPSKATGTADKEALISVLDEGADNSLVSLLFRRDSSVDNSNIIPNTNNTGLIIDYVESEIDNQAYVNDLVNNLSWEKMFSVSADGLTADLVLPTKWYGADVTWSSSNTAALANDGSITAGYESVPVELTATLAYKGLSDEYKTATKTFEVVVAPQSPVTVKIPLTNPVYTRGGSYANEYQWGKSAYNSMMVGTAPYRAYAQLDLSGYQEILRNPHTTVTFSAANGGYRSTSYIRDFKVYVAKDSCDSYDRSTIVYNVADKLGLHDSNRPVLFIDNDGVAHGANGQYNVVKGPANKDALLTGLNEGVDNDIVTLSFESLAGESCLETSANYTYLTISYFENEINDAQHGADMAAEFAWDKFSNDELNFVTSATKLPLKYKGLDVVWTSTDASAVNPQTGVVTTSDSYKNVSLTASLSYKGVSYGTKDFNIRVAKNLVAVDGINDGSKALSISAGPVSTIEAKGVGGKAPTDSYINYANTFTDSQKYYPVNVDTANGADDIFEFSALVPEDSDGMHFYIGIYGTSGLQIDDRMTLPFTIKADGIYFGYLSQSYYKIVSLDATKWNNYAFVAPKSMTGAVDEEGNSLDDKSYEIYVNGEKVFENSAQITNGGFAYIRFLTVSESADDTAIYFDNMRTYSGEYNPNYDKLPAFSSTLGIVDNKIVLKDSSATVADVIASITIGEDAYIRVYNASGALVTDYTVAANGTKIVVADRNGTTLERSYSSYEVVSAEGRDVVFAAPKLTWVNGVDLANVSVLNYSAAPVSYQVYVAVYENEQLIRVTEATLTAQPGESATVAPSVSANVSQKAKLLVWEEDGITPVFAPVEYN